MLNTAFLNKEDETRGNTGTAQKSAQYIQPAQEPVFKMLQVQAGQKFGCGFGEAVGRILTDHGSGHTVKVDAFANQSHPVTACPVNADIGILVTDVVHHQKADFTGHIALGPATFGFGHHGINGGHRCIHP